MDIVSVADRDISAFTVHRYGTSLRRYRESDVAVRTLLVSPLVCANKILHCIFLH